MSLRYSLLLLAVITSPVLFSQTVYPKITGYFGIMHPVVTFSEHETNVNFRDYYAVGFPTGINIWKSEKIGFSFEIVPNIKDDQGTDKVTNLLFHPGVLVALAMAILLPEGLLLKPTAGMVLLPYLIKPS